MGSTSLGVSGLQSPLSWKILPLDVQTAFSLPTFKSLFKGPFVPLSQRPSRSPFIKGSLPSPALLFPVRYSLRKSRGFACLVCRCTRNLEPCLAQSRHCKDTYLLSEMEDQAVASDLKVHTNTNNNNSIDRSWLGNVHALTHPGW